jgi:hypothetical protein
VTVDPASGLGGTTRLGAARDRQVAGRTFYTEQHNHLNGEYMRVLTAAVLIASLAACSSGTAAPVDATAQTNQQVVTREIGKAFEMKIGETIGVGDLVLTFQRVENDSRCPIDAVCVWTGDAEIALRVQQGSQAAVAALHTHVEPRRTIWNGYTIQFVSLAPSLSASSPVDPAQYRAQLLVTR